MFSWRIGTLAVLLMGMAPAHAADWKPVKLRGAVDSDDKWTGFYVGASIGYGAVEDRDPTFTPAPGVTFLLRSTGDDLVNGFQGGYSHQFKNIVVGVEYQYTNLDIEFVGQGLGPGGANVPLGIDVDDSHAGKFRLGYAWNNFHVYVFGGALYTDVTIGLEEITPLVGGGIEYAINDHVSIGAEYNFSFFDSFDNLPLEGDLDIVTARLNFRF